MAAADQKLASTFEAERSCLKAYWVSGATRGLTWRKQQLFAVAKMLVEHAEEAAAALASDLGKPYPEAMLEIHNARLEAMHSAREVGGWMKPEFPHTHILVAPAHTEVRREPFGVALIVAPFNYPLNLAIAPLVGAICGGNCAVVKPSEMCPATENFLKRYLPTYLDPKAFAVHTGGIAASGALLSLNWDFVFFTGSPRVGTIVARACAEHLTPNVLELGGKSATLVDASCLSVGEAARRTAFGKFMNAGQTCMAPDYVLVHESLYDKFVAALVEKTAAMLGADEAARRRSADFGRIVTPQHCARLIALVKSTCAAQAGGVATVKMGGDKHADEAARYFPPTVVALTRGALGGGGGELVSLLGEEIFGPVLPVLPFKDYDDACAIVRQIDSEPLALYVFARDRVAEKYLAALPSGDAIVNDTFMHVATAGIPFGGYGRSGHGAYHGKHGFECFTYKRGLLKRHGIMDIAYTVPTTCANLRYPPTDAIRSALLHRFMRWLPSVPAPLFTLRNSVIVGMVWYVKRNADRAALGSALRALAAALGLPVLW